MSSGGYRTEKTSGVATEAQVVGRLNARSVRAGGFLIFCVYERGRKILSPSQQASEWVREKKKEIHMMPASAMFSWPLRTLRLNLTCTKKNRCQPGALRSHKNSQQQQLPHTNAFGYFLFFSQGRCLFEINIMRPVAAESCCTFLVHIYAFLLKRARAEISRKPWTLAHL
jgi:hypothetical protein